MRFYCICVWGCFKLVA